MTTIDPVADPALFDVEAPPPITLGDKFGVAPMSILDRRTGEWQARKRAWLSLGIESEIGRGEALTYSSAGATDPVSLILLENGGTSVFDPVVCELVYRWFSRAGDRVLDPFAGGSVRGVTASILARYYIGIDIRAEQVEANEAQAHIGSDITPRWVTGDSARMRDVLDDDEFDLVFTCPPYGDLERYSDDPHDLSTMPAVEFDATHAAIIREACAHLRRDRFACWVISDVRDNRGAYRGLVAQTIAAFTAAGLTLHNDAVLADPVGTAAIRAERPFRATRKLTRVHQHLLVFCKGDPKAATARLDDIDTPK